MTCPACSAEFKVKLFASINVSVSPELKGPLLDGSLFDHDCPKCGKLSRFGTVLLYHDMERRFHVWLRPEGDAPEPAVASMFECGPVGEGYRLRWVEQAYELADKVRVLDAGLDDRLVELVKVWMLRRTEDLDVPLVYARLATSRECIEFHTSDGGTLSASFDQFARLREHFARKLDPDRGWQKIDRRFALRVLGLA